MTLTFTASEQITTYLTFGDYSGSRTSPVAKANPVDSLNFLWCTAYSNVEMPPEITVSNTFSFDWDPFATLEYEMVDPGWTSADPDELNRFGRLDAFIGYNHVGDASGTNTINFGTIQAQDDPGNAAPFWDHGFPPGGYSGWTHNYVTGFSTAPESTDNGQSLIRQFAYDSGSAFTETLNTTVDVATMELAGPLNNSESLVFGELMMSQGDHIVPSQGSDSGYDYSILSGSTTFGNTHTTTGHSRRNRTTYSSGRFTTASGEHSDWIGLIFEIADSPDEPERAAYWGVKIELV